MPNYRRNWIQGGTFFFTVNLYNRSQHWLTDHIGHLRTATRQCRQHHPFHIHAWVVLPEHLHCIWTLPDKDHDYARRWRYIKSRFAHLLKQHIEQTNLEPIWQKRYWEHTLINQKDLNAHMDYIHYNPVKHGWVNRVKDWPYSTFHRCVENGLYTENWAGNDVVLSTIQPGE